MGALEDEVMEYLWAAGTAVLPGDVHRVVAPELGYTTLTTVLTRLWEKGRVIRVPSGRSFLYSPLRSEAEHRAEAMSSSLDNAADRAAVLSSFVETLSSRDMDVLRSLLGREK